MEGDFTPLGGGGESKKRKRESMEKTPRRPSTKNHQNRGLLSQAPEAGKTDGATTDSSPKADPSSLRPDIPDPVKGNPRPAAETLRKYDRGEGRKRFLVDKKRGKRNETKIEKAKEAAARAELLLQEEAGFVEETKRTKEDDDDDDLLTQEDIRRAVDITTAQKIFDLKLDKLGPYRHRFTRNGRFLLLGGAMGHLAAFDWQTKRLACEFSVNETVRDVAWLHNETMFAVAQKAYTCVYDNQGTELHCLRRIDGAVRLEFLPYHFLLAAGNAKGFLKYLDVSVGKFIGGAQTGAGQLSVMTQNPKNGVVLVGTPQGTVSFWSPASTKSLASVLTSRCGVKSVATTSCGNYFAAGSVDRVVSVWDVRMMKETTRLRTSTVPSYLTFSQRNHLAAGVGQVVDVFPETVLYEPVQMPYMTHRLPSFVSGLQFCPFEDVLGVTHGTGYSSLIIPGSGEPNFDALENNPFQSRKMRQEAEVKALLEKVPPEMISMDSEKILDVNLPEMKKKLAERKKVNYVKVAEVDFTPRHKKKGRSSAGNTRRRVQMVKSNHKRLVVKGELLNAKLEALNGKKKKRKMGKNKKEQGASGAVSSKATESADSSKDQPKNKGGYALQRFVQKSQ